METPKSKPKMPSAQLHELISPFNIDRIKYPVLVIGIRGYYKDTLGLPGKNDIGIYDDAIFIDSKEASVSFNANTDPSVKRPGIATLVANAVYLYKIGMHNMKAPYKALRQFGRVTVIRAGQSKPETDTSAAPFYIDIHKGGFNTTSSLGCQTIHPTQWPSFIALVEGEMKRNNQTVIPYILIEQS
ncbi:hypothetical protein [Flavobacterium sp.]|uniref:hypothetical protein n=1 Tax=Flavobacterium sp. TaxID=239 RepID=UPI00260FEB49|nr:hypothetical protein [Flavobacterium sp.]